MRLACGFDGPLGALVGTGWRGAGRLMQDYRLLVRHLLKKSFARRESLWAQAGGLWENSVEAQGAALDRSKVNGVTTARPSSAYSY
jgi:hypothetical protein